MLSLLLFGMVQKLILRFDALIMHPRQENVSLPSRKTAFVLFYLPFVAQTNAGDVVDPPGWFGQLFYRDGVPVCKSTLNLLAEPQEAGVTGCSPNLEPG